MIVTRARLPPSTRSKTRFHSPYPLTLCELSNFSDDCAMFSKLPGFRDLSCKKFTSSVISPFFSSCSAFSLVNSPVRFETGKTKEMEVEDSERVTIFAAKRSIIATGSRCSGEIAGWTPAEATRVWETETCTAVETLTRDCLFPGSRGCSMMEKAGRSRSPYVHSPSSTLNRSFLLPS